MMYTACLYSGKCALYEFVHWVIRFATVGVVPGFNMYLPCYDARDALSIIAETPFGPGTHGCSPNLSL